MTKIYNRVIDESDLSTDVVRLRELHVELDAAVAAAYGWEDLKLDHGVYEHDRFGPRWIVDRDRQVEIEKRLLALNHSRSAL